MEESICFWEDEILTVMGSHAALGLWRFGPIYAFAGSFVAPATVHLPVPPWLMEGLNLTGTVR